MSTSSGGMENNPNQLVNIVTDESNIIMSSGEEEDANGPSSNDSSLNNQSGNFSSIFNHPKYVSATNVDQSNLFDFETVKSKKRKTKHQLSTLCPEDEEETVCTITREDSKPLPFNFYKNVKIK